MPNTTTLRDLVAQRRSRRNISDLNTIADQLRGVSRFQLAEYKREAEQNKGPLAGLTRWDIGQITRTYEHRRMR